MKKTDLRQKNLDQLLPLFGERAAQSVERIIWEDFILDEAKFPNEEMSEADLSKVAELFEKLKAGHPIQYLVGKAMFFKMLLEVTPDVLIPRPETEELVYNFTELLKREGVPAKPILDIGTGSGCIALALKQAYPDTKIIAVDKSEGALEVAKRNAEKLGLEIDFRQMDILNKEDWEKLPELGAIISNPPYIPHAEKAIMEKNVLSHEPESALFVSDDDPMLFYNAIAEFGVEKLEKDAWFAVEMNANLPSETMGVFLLKGYQNLSIEKDMSHRYRILTGKKG